MLPAADLFPVRPNTHTAAHYLNISIGTIVLNAFFCDPLAAIIADIKSLVPLKIIATLIMFTLKEFGNRISMLRKLQNLTQDELAERIHVSKDHISRIERGIRACSLESLIDLAQELHTSTDYLLTGTGPDNDFAKEQLLLAIEVLSSVSKLI